MPLPVRCATALFIALGLAAAPAAIAAPPGFILPPAQLTPQFAGGFTAPGHIAMSPGGSAFVAYSNGNDANNAQFARVRAAGGSWSDPLPLTTKGTYGGNAIVADGENSATVLYIGHDDADGHYRIYARSVDPAGLVGGPEAISPPGVDVQALAADGDGAGHVAVAWSDSGKSVRVRRRSAGAPFTPDAGASAIAGSVGGVTAVDVAVAGAGDTAVTWAGYSDAGATKTDVFATVLGGPLKLLSAATTQISGVDVAGSPDGTVAVGFSQSLIAFVSIRQPGANFAAPTAAGAIATGWPHVAVDGFDTVYATWATPAAAGHDIATVLSTTHPGEPFGDGVLVPSGPGDVKDSPLIAADPAGDLLLGWYQGSGLAYKGVFVPAGGAAQVTTIADSAVNFATYNGLHGQPVLDAHGDGMVSIMGDTAVNYATLEGAAFDNGPLLSSLTVPATATAGQPVGFAVAPVGVWSPVAGDPGWSFGDGASATGTAPSHSFAAPGTYTVTVSATNARGVSSSTARIVRVGPAPAPAPPGVGPPTVKPPPVVKRCVVPRLTGKTLTAAKKSLNSAKCALGKVTRPRKKTRATLIVTKQTKAGTKLSATGKVSLTLGRKPKKKTRH
jgi:hypothetical protein